MTDERMEMLLKESFVNIRPGAELQEKLLQRLYAQEQVLTGRQQGNRYNLRRRVLTTACVLAALLVTGCAAMEIVKHYRATEITTEYANYEDLQQAAQDLGKTFRTVETFSNGFDFQSAALVNTRRERSFSEISCWNFFIRKEPISSPLEWKQQKWGRRLPTKVLKS